MDQVSAQTEKIATYETARTRRSLVDGNLHSDDSNNDEEYETSGFYVREKTSEKKKITPEETPKVPNDDDVSNSDIKQSASDSAIKENDIKENGCLEKDVSSPELNGENSKDGENNLQKENNETNSENNNKDNDIEPEKQEVNGESSKEEESENKDSENGLSGNDSAKEEETNRDSKLEESNDENKTSDLDSGKEENIDSKIDSRKEEESEESNENKASNIDSGKEEEEIVATENKELEDKEEPIKEPENKSNNLEAEKEENNISSTSNKEINEENNVPSNSIDEPEVAKQNEDSTNEKLQAKEDEVIEIIEDNKNDDKEVIEIIEDNKNGDKEIIEIIDVEPTKEKSTRTSKTRKSNNNSKNEDKVIDFEGSILKDHLEKPSSSAEDNNDPEEDMDEDFDPSLLCPDISMDIDEAPVMTSADHSADDGSTSPLPYEPIFSTLVDEITGAEVHVDLTPEEMELRKRMYGPNNPVQATKIHCTACNVHLGSALIGANNRFVHPLLKVLICKNCYHFYTSGEFEKDEDGSELYCRWCGQGGQVLCCSSCEFVFCKRCIRNNFGPKKFKEIRDSDDWNCFRCNPEQLSNLRASCAEFMEYYRTELARAQTLADTKPELMITDYTKCCSSASEKKEEPKTSMPQKTRKKKRDNEDPDYRPVLDDDEPPAKKPVPAGGPGYSVIQPAGLRQIVPKTIGTPATTIRQVGSQPLRTQATTGGQIFRMGNTTFRAKAVGTATGFSIQRPPMQQGQKITTGGSVSLKSVSKTSTPGYIKILPQKVTGTTRPSSTYTVVSGTNNGKPTFSTVRPAKPNVNMPQMKHEWFEKTVRAAARVNSNLSYTLTQLNRQQSQAGSVEALAMVHNKLQEVLSTSINSLIQIRKNLRTEFIAGIKNIKFPPKPPATVQVPTSATSIVVKDDDDVIFINTPTTNVNQPPPLILSPNVTLTKKNTLQKNFSKPSTSGVKTNISKANNKPEIITTTTTTSTGPLKGGFLKVRSLTSLQTVPSECITIPDDPPVVAAVEKDPLSIVDDGTLNIPETIIIEPEISKSRDSKPKTTRRLKDIRRQSKEPEVVGFSTPALLYNVNEAPSPEIKKMMDAFVALKRSPEVDQLVQAQGLVNGDSDAQQHNNSETGSAS